MILELGYGQTRRVTGSVLQLSYNAMLLAGLGIYAFDNKFMKPKFSLGADRCNRVMPLAIN